MAYQAQTDDCVGLNLFSVPRLPLHGVSMVF